MRCCYLCRGPYPIAGPQIDLQQSTKLLDVRVVSLFVLANLEMSCSAIGPPPQVCALSAGKGNKDLSMQVLHKTGSVQAHETQHGNPFLDDEGRHDKSPLLIGSADSSYAFDPPRR